MGMVHAIGTDTICPLGNRPVYYSYYLRHLFPFLQYKKMPLSDTDILDTHSNSFLISLLQVLFSFMQFFSIINTLKQK